jgi:hypothetical protein
MKKSIIYEFMDSAGALFYVKSNVSLELTAAIFQLKHENTLMSYKEFKTSEIEKQIIDFEIIDYDTNK